MSQTESSAELKRAGRRVGYVIAIAINIALLVVVNNILQWGWFGFITDEWADVTPWISVSLLASTLANLVYVFNDAPVVKSSGQLVTNLIALVATYQMFRVFPFDFSGYAFDWAIVVRIVLIVGIVGTGIGAIVEAFRLVSGGRSERVPARS